LWQRELFHGHLNRLKAFQSTVGLVILIVTATFKEFNL
jgi:hypothetical protein